jgi:HEAT repeat protein
MTASAVETLGPLAEPLIPDLTALLEHEEREVRITAARGLCRMRSAAARAVPAIVALLKSDDDRQRYQVANALSELGSQAKAAAPELAERVKDVENVYPDPTLKLLAAIGPDAKVAIPALMEVAKNTKHRRQLDALETLARIGPDAKAAVPLLVNQLSAQSSYDRTRAAKALGVFGPIAKDAVPKLRELLEDPEDAVRVWASFALARITGDYEPNIETILSYWLDPADRWVPLGATADANSEIADALAMLGTDAKPAQKWVVRKLGDPKISAGAQSHLCRVVSNLKDEAAIPMLVELLEHADPEGWSTGSILDALATFGSEAKGAKKQVEALLDHDRQEVADAAARALRRIDTPVR